jgi:hypothetical protein
MRASYPYPYSTRAYASARAEAETWSETLRHGFFLVGQVACALLSLGLIIYNLAILNLSIVELHGNDFGKFYFAVQSWLHDGSLYEPTIATHMQVGLDWHEFLNLNPPHFHILLLPFVALPLRWATYAWVIANICFGTLAMAIVWRELGLRLRSAWVLPSLTLLLASGATGAVLLTGQFPGLLLVPLVMAWRAARRGEPSVTGVWLGVLISIKPFFGLFLVACLLGRQWRTVFVALLAMACAFALGVAIFGVEEHRGWVAAMTHVEWAWAAMNGSWNALLSRALTASPYYMPVGVFPVVLKVLLVVGNSAILFLTLRSARRSVDDLFAAIPLGALLISPLGWVYYLWLCLPGCVAIWRRGVPVTGKIAVVLLLAPYFGPMLWTKSAVATLTVGSIYTWATLVLWYGACFRKEERAAESPISEFAAAF